MAKVVAPHSLLHELSVRYTVIKQITDRHPLFKPSADDSEEKFKIYPIEHLLSSSKRLNKIITMGLFSQLKIGYYHLEDPSGIVQLDLSETISFSIAKFILHIQIKMTVAAAPSACQRWDPGRCPMHSLFVSHIEARPWP
jgi:hypothetical protein